MAGIAICALLALAAAGVSAADMGPLRREDFASAETCKPCHTEIYQQWRSSFHSQASTDSLFWQFFQQASRDAGSRASALCLTCHVPVATVTRQAKWFGPVPSQIDLDPVAWEGVTCDFCHTISGEENLGRNVSLGAYRLPRKGATNIKYGSHPDARSTAHPTQASAFLRSSQLCAICHSYTHPLPGLEFQNTYAEWYHGPYRAQGRECSHCHMPSYAGRATSDSPERPDIRAHVFLGGHGEMVKEAARVSLSGRVFDRGGAKRVRINALVTNVGSGHLMPTGIPGIRQLWLDLRVVARGGSQVFAGRQDYGVTLLGAKGNPAMPWNAVRRSADTRLPPRRSRRAAFEFMAPGPDLGTLEARATLYYRLVSERAATSVGIEPSPPIEVASDRLLIFPDGWVGRRPVRRGQAGEALAGR